MKKLSFQKLFCFISFLFIFSCCVFYGTRFIKLYLESKKTQIVEENSLAKALKEKHKDDENFKSINGSNYFINNEEKNYLMYSGILWRIIKINTDNSILLISNNSVTSLSYGETDYENSYINKWLTDTDKEYSNIFEKELNDKEKYLEKTTTCVDSMDELTNNVCTKTSEENYVTTLSSIDYLNVGSKNSYLNTNEYFYLSNINSENKIWYISNDGKPAVNKGTDGYGVKPVIKLKPNINHIKGDGTKENPYVIEEKNGLFGSYVKLGNDYWRIYKTEDKTVRLVLNDYLKVNGNELEQIYSNTSSYHNDTKAGSIAYYLNNNFLNSLSYKDIIDETDWPNGFYGSESKYDYEQSLNKTIKTKVAMQSIGDIILNTEATNYMIMTGNTQNGNYIYSMLGNKKLITKSINQELYVIPTIAIDSSLLTKGTGSYESPYEME